jgi:hypothetical protein
MRARWALREAGKDYAVDLTYVKGKAHGDCQPLL